MRYLSTRTSRIGIVFTVALLTFFFGNNIGQKTSPFLRQTAATKHVPRIEAGASYPIIGVIDGDTIDVDINGEPEKIRLIGLDTPETVDPKRPTQCFGFEASNKAKSILSGQKVKIETDPSQDLRDKYGRLLAYIFLSDGTLFNEMMIAEGYGHEYTYRLPYKYQKEFKAAEREAQKLRKGLWADDVCKRTAHNKFTGGLF
jgi:micrococcal nuclease